MPTLASGRRSFQEALIYFYDVLLEYFGGVFLFYDYGLVGVLSVMYVLLKELKSKHSQFEVKVKMNTFQ